MYRNLVVLEQAGVVRRVTSTDDFARYELAEDLTEHHHHLICSSCGTVDDFTASRRFGARCPPVFPRRSPGSPPPLLSPDRRRSPRNGSFAALTASRRIGSTVGSFAALTAALTAALPARSSG